MGFRLVQRYFHRQIKSSARPIAEPDNPKVIVSANDGTVYKIAWEVAEEDRFWVKGQPYSLRNMLDGSTYIDRFLHGTVFQTFLSGANYHRWRAPIDGTVRAAYVVEGARFLLLRRVEYAADLPAGSDPRIHGAEQRKR